MYCIGRGIYDFMYGFLETEHYFSFLQDKKIEKGHSKTIDPLRNRILSEACPYMLLRYEFSKSGNKVSCLQSSLTDHNWDQQLSLSDVAVKSRDHANL